MEQSDLLRKLANELEKLGITYLVTGSMATIAYGEPRFTNDIDVVVDLKANDVSAFCDAFPNPDFYLPRDYVADSVRRQFQFNILHPASGLKIDVMIPSNSEFDRSRLQRGMRLGEDTGSPAWFASPEDVIIKKLEYFREGGSEKHVRDILGVLRIQAEKIDRDYITKWVVQLGLTEQWDMMLERLAMG